MTKTHNTLLRPFELARAFWDQLSTRRTSHKSVMKSSILCIMIVTQLLASLWFPAKFTLHNRDNSNPTLNASLRCSYVPFQNGFTTSHALSCYLAVPVSFFISVGGIMTRTQTLTSMRSPANATFRFQRGVKTVKSSMLSIIATQQKILNTIVGNLPVYVMNNLNGSQITSKFLFHHKPVFQDIAAISAAWMIWFVNVDVSISTDFTLLSHWGEIIKCH